MVYVGRIWSFPVEFQFTHEFSEKYLWKIPDLFLFL